MSEASTEPTQKPTKRPTKRTRKWPPSDPIPPETEITSEAKTSESAPETSGNRPNRRRGKKGKGQGESKPQQIQTAQENESEPLKENGAKEPQPEKPPAHRPLQPPRPSRHDPKDLGNKAWKIYLAEVSEEGIALINDQDAREIARRCFRLSEIFLDEQARQR